MLVDSNILIYGAKASHPEVDAILDRLDLSASVITRLETLGFHQLSDLDQRWLETAFSRMTVLPFSEDIEVRAIHLRQQRRMSLADAIIAATALVHGQPLVTRNVDDFRHVEGLRIINPFGRIGEKEELNHEWTPMDTNGG